jgi:integrase
MRLFRRRNANGTWTWWASWTESGRTVRRSTKCSAKANAELVVARWERERADPVYAAATAATFGVEAAQFLRACEDATARGKMAAGTLTMYRQKAGSLVRILGSDLRLADVHGETFADYLDARRGEAIRETTLYKEWVTFRRILHQAWRAGRFGRDPASLKPEHFSQEYEPRTTALSWEQATALLDALPSARVPAVAFALGTGARRKEVFAAQAGDVDTEAWTVRIRGTKTDTSAAVVPVPAPMRHLVEHGAPPFAPWPNARRDLAIACQRAGVPAVTWNDLRRTFASLLIQAGVEPHVVARLLRHKSTAMTDKVYARTTTESLGRLLEAQLARGPSVDQARATKAPKRGRSRPATPKKPARSRGPSGA